VTVLVGWRIYKPKHAATAFTGEGARLFGGRFNSKGVAVVYTAGSASLAAMEMLVHLQATDLLAEYRICPVEFDDALVRTLDPADLPRGWRRSPPPAGVQAVGDAWVAAADSAVLRVPSAVVDPEHNYLLNPSHPDFAKVVIGKPRRFLFDPRLVKTPPKP
jgi:RES domain-containing protein